MPKDENDKLDNFVEYIEFRANIEKLHHELKHKIIKDVIGKNKTQRID